MDIISRCVSANDILIFVILFFTILWVGTFLCFCEIIRLLRKTRCVYNKESGRDETISVGSTIHDSFEDEYAECWQGNPMPDKRIKTLGG